MDMGDVQMDGGPHGSVRLAGGLGINGGKMHRAGLSKILTGTQ